MFDSFSFGCSSIWFDPGVVIGLEREAYQISEDGGFIEVCAVIRDGSIDRTVELLLSTSDLTAESKS